MRNIFRLFILFGVLFFVAVHCVAQQDGLQKIGLDCRQKYIARQIVKVLLEVKRENLLIGRFVSRIREAKLKNVSCRLLLRVLRKELRVQKRAYLLLKASRCYSKETHALFINLLYFGLRPYSLRSLLGACQGRLNQSVLARSAYFLFYMKKLGWQEQVLLPLATYVVRGRLRNNLVEGVKQLLLYGRDLKISNPKVALLVLRGLTQGKSIRKIRYVLKENTLF